MLNNPAFPYERTARNLGLTKQRIGQLAKNFGVDGRQRERERIIAPLKENWTFNSIVRVTPAGILPC
jgi:hypothetical protein